MLYVWIILIGNIAIITGNLAFSRISPLPEGILGAILLPILNTVAVIAFDGIAAFFIRRLPEKWFSSESKLSIVSRRECKFYTILGVRKWRSKVPELGMFTNFRKNKVYEPSSNDYLKRYILEANYGVIIHFACVIVGFAILFICHSACALRIGLPVAIVNAILNLMPTFVLRYNLPKLQSLIRMNERRARKT